MGRGKVMVALEQLDAATADFTTAIDLRAAIDPPPPSPLKSAELAGRRSVHTKCMVGS